MSAAGDTAQELSLAQIEIHRLRMALEKIADLSCRDTKKAEQCEHGLYGYEHCENCIAEFAAGVLRHNVK
jgi:hypothetical protein